MRIFNWMQNKLNGSHSTKKTDLVSSSVNYFIQEESCKEEFVEWPHGLLAIGTIGNIYLKGPFIEESQDHTPKEEVAELQNAVNMILSETEDSEADKETRKDSISDDDSNNKEAHLQRRTKSGGISKKSFSFLLKKMITRSRGTVFASPAPSLKDPVSKHQLKKIMKAILHKKMKIYPQSSSKTLKRKKYLKNRSVDKPESTDDVLENDDVKEAENGSKWVKTDSEYIVLEI